MNVNYEMEMGSMLYENKVYDEERALYGVRNAEIINCRFEGPADGESALKETADLNIRNCGFFLRYPLWHTDNAVINDCFMTETCRAALWYDKNVIIKNSVMGGIKAVRECDNTEIYGSKINSTEFGWFCRGLKMSDCEMISEYPFLHTCDMKLDGLTMQGKYSFQYVENAEIHNSVLDTKDAFWHGKNITVYDSVVKGEYLGWYSENLKFIRCKIIGTQPLCYAKGLVLEDCEMTGCDLSFENSEVSAKIKGDITSVKNPKCGEICAGSIGEIIMDKHAPDSTCRIITNNGGLKRCG